MKNLTQGNIYKNMIFFAIPLVLGNLFQLTYNAVDSIIVGRYAGKVALAAVGTSNPVMNIVILGISGICIGASVLMSQFYGAGKMTELKKEVSTTLIFGLFFSFSIVILGLLGSKWIMVLLGTKDELLDQSVLYLRIIFLGMPFTFAYNAMASALRSVGDSKTPLKFLALASVLNGCLDVVFVAIFHMGVLGAGLATVIAEGVSALLCFIYVYKHVPTLSIAKNEWHIDTFYLKQTLSHGFITALQQSCQPIGKLLIQGQINALGVDAIASYNAVGRIDDYAYTPQQSIASAMMTFIAQNKGAGKKKRIQKGFFAGMVIEVGYWVILCITVLLIKHPVMVLFVGPDEVELIRIGVDYLTLMSFFYLLPAFTNGIQGFFRGVGNMKITLISTLIQITFRVIFVYILVPSIGISGVAYASLVGWLFMIIYEFGYYGYYMKKNF